MFGPYFCAPVPCTPTQGNALEGIESWKSQLEVVKGPLGSVIIFLILLYRIQKEALLQAVLKVVDQRPFEMLDATRVSQGVALIWVQLQWIVAFYLHQSVQELSAVLEVHPRFGRTQHKDNGGKKVFVGTSFSIFIMLR